MQPAALHRGGRRFGAEQLEPKAGLYKCVCGTTKILLPDVAWKQTNSDKEKKQTSRTTLLVSYEVYAVAS
jgi:hypothetical protein